MDTNANKKWFKDGLRHRDGGYPACIYGNGDKYWYVDGLLHREDGPAIELDNGYKEWRLNGVLQKATKGDE